MKFKLCTSIIEKLLKLNILVASCLCLVTDSISIRRVDLLVQSESRVRVRINSLPDLSENSVTCQRCICSLFISDTQCTVRIQPTSPSSSRGHISNHKNRQETAPQADESIHQIVQAEATLHRQHRSPGALDEVPEVRHGIPCSIQFWIA